METPQATQTVVETPAQATQPAVTPPVVITPEVSLVSKVAGFKKEEPAKPAIVEEKFDYKQLETIKTPEEAKKWAEEAYKSFQRGENKKYQEIADIRKDLEKKLSELSNWTPERVQALLNEPTFVNAAQTIMQSQNPQGSGLTDEQYSNLSDAEKGRIQKMENELTSLKNQNLQNVMAQQDSELKLKYANYDPQAIDDVLRDLNLGKIQATREHIHKIIDYEPGIMRAYEMGKAEGQKIISEKLNSLSFQPGVNVKGQDTLPSGGKLNDVFFKQLYNFNVTKQKENQLRK